METATTKYKVDIKQIEIESVESAFGENRFRVNEDGLSNKALDAKKSAIAVQVAAKLFTRAALAALTEQNGTVAPTDRRRVEQIAVEAINHGDECIVYLEQFCEEAKA